MPEKGEVKAMLPVTRWLITGGCGFIGSSIIRNADGGHSVRVVDNLCVGTRADLAKVCQFTETAAGEVQPMRAPSGDATRVAAGLGWHFTTPLREGLRHTVAWFAAENARS